MNDKVNVEIVVPEIGETYDMFLPINKKMGTILKLLNKSINEMSNGDLPISDECKLYNANTMQIYEANILLYNTDIRNSTKLVLLTK